MGVKFYQLVGLGLTTSAWTGVWTGSDWILSQTPAIAQIAADGSLGTLVNGSASMSCLSATCTITGGTLNRASSTLLHSFDQFSLGQSPNQSLNNASGQAITPTALFIDPGVADIVVRVTGDSASLINGAIHTSAGSSANLFLVNPSGIQFGSSAQLNLGGAFIASTANSILFDQGIELSAGDPTAASSSLLTISAPVGLGFLAGHANGSITVQGTGNRLSLGSNENADQFISRVFQQSVTTPAESNANPISGAPRLPPLSELTVKPGAAIALIANGVELTGGNLTAAGGQIEIGSIESGTALLNADLSIDYSRVNRFADITLTDRSTLDTSAINPGIIKLRAQDMAILDSSAILAEVLPALSGAIDNASGKGGLIDLQAKGTIQISGFTENPSTPFNPPFHTAISVDVTSGARAAGGLLNIHSHNLIVNQGGQISANAYGIGNAGRLQITANDTLTISDGSPLGASGLFAITGQQGNSNSGQIDINTGHLLLREGAQVLTSSRNEGAAGRISIEADRISLTGMRTAKTSQPDGTVRTVHEPTLLQSGMGTRSTGQGGDLSIRADQISVTDGAKIATTTLGPGRAGTINITAKDLEVSGFPDLAGPSAILTTVALRATGDGGALNIDTDRLRVLNGAQIRTGTLGSGMSGDLVINSDSVLVSGQVAQGRSGLFADAIGGTGGGGNLIIKADTVDVTDGATLNVSNFPIGTNAAIPLGQGAAGDLRVSANRINVSGRSLLSAETAAGDRGNITLTTQLLTLRDNSQITTNAIHDSTGGNIEINAANGFVLAVPSENSDITANAVFGNGGRVSISAQQVLGLRVSPALTPLSDITASSEFGVAGEVRLETFSLDLRSEAIPLAQFAEVATLAQGCGAAGSGSTSRFVQTGRGGIGTNPYDVLDSRDSLSDVSLPATLAAPDEANSPSLIPSLITEAVPIAENQPSAASFLSEAQSAAPSTAPLVEAQGWTKNEQGEVTLWAEVPLEVPSGEGERCLSWRS